MGSEEDGLWAPDAAAKISKAAWQLEDAIAEKVCEVYPDSLQSRSDFFAVLRMQKWHDRMLLLMIVLTIWETPTWCNTGKTWEWESPESRCTRTSEAEADVMLSGVHYLPPGYSLILEVVILATLAYKLYLEYLMQARHFEPAKQRAEAEEEELPNNDKDKEEEENGEYFPIWKIKFCLLMIVLELIDVIVFAKFRFGVRLFFVTRTCLLCMLPSVIKLCGCIRKILVEVGTVAVFFVGFLFFFAWISAMIFISGSSNPQPKEGVVAVAPPKHFSTFPRAFYALFVAGVCDEFTDILLESYTTYRWIGTVWFVFLLVVHLLFLSLVLDTLCAGYMKSEKEETEQILEEKAQGVLKAFSLVNSATCDSIVPLVPKKDVPHRISKTAFLRLLEEYVRSPGVPNTPHIYAKNYFQSGQAQVYNIGGKEYIDEDEFSKILALTQYKMWWTRQDSCVATKYPTIWNKPLVERFRRDVRNPDGGTFFWTMMGVLGVNFVLVLFETTYDLELWTEPWYFDTCEYMFSVIYLGECVIKIGVSGWDYYRSSFSNVFDLFTTLLLLATSIAEGVLGPSASTYANVLRLFRLLRVVKQLKGMPQVQFMTDTVVKLVCKSKDMLVLLLVVIFGFTVTSVQMFGGLLYEGNDRLWERDEDARKHETQYYDEKEFVLNFNDFLMAFGLWFVFLLCEYKPSIPAAINRTARIPEAWLIFLLFWTVAVCITFELVKAFTIEVYMDLKKKFDQRKSAKKNPASADETPPSAQVLNAIEKFYDAKNEKFWYACMAVDEGEWDDVHEKILELLERQMSEGEGIERQSS
jgi:hypothetical protein